MSRKQKRLVNNSKKAKEVVLLTNMSALIPLIMSAIGLLLIFGYWIYSAIFNIPPQEDEGTAARLWQLLMVGQIPVILYFTFTYFFKYKRTALRTLVVIGGAIVLNFVTFYIFEHR